MEKGLITAHTIVRNEDHFIWFALQSVLPYVDKIIVYDTGSTDQTVAIIKTIKSDKIILEKRGKTTPVQLVTLRQEMIAKTTTPFFLLLDGDEIWPEEAIKKMVETVKGLPKEKVVVVCRTRNCIGDIWHYLPEAAGKYHLAGHTGHLSMRLFRKVPELNISGEYPLETYNLSGQSLNKQDNKLFFLDTWYLHATHLVRSSSTDKVYGFRRQKTETGLSLSRPELPAVLFYSRPTMVPDPTVHRSLLYELAANLMSPVKSLKRLLIK